MNNIFKQSGFSFTPTIFFGKKNKKKISFVLFQSIAPLNFLFVPQKSQTNKNEYEITGIFEHIKATKQMKAMTKMHSYSVVFTYRMHEQNKTINANRLFVLQIRNDAPNSFV